MSLKRDTFTLFNDFYFFSESGKVKFLSKFVKKTLLVNRVPNLSLQSVESDLQTEDLEREDLSALGVRQIFLYRFRVLQNCTKPFHTQNVCKRSANFFS